MAQLDLSAVWKPDPGRQSGGARLLGMARLSLRQLQHRFLESFLILLSIALGVGVLTGMGAFLRFLVALEAEMLSSQAELQAVIVRPRTFDTTELWSAGAPPAVRLTADVVQPIQLTTEDLLAARSELPGAAYVVASGGTMNLYPIASAGGRPVQADGEALEASHNLHLRLQWATPDEMAFRGRTLVAGASFTWNDYAEGRHVLILEEESVQKLFPGLEPAEAVGRAITTVVQSGAQGGGWQITGVVAKQELSRLAAAAVYPEAPNEVTGYAPHTASQSPPVALNQISVAPAPGVSAEQLASDVDLFFAQRHGPDRVMVTNPAEVLREINRSQRTSVLTLLGLAALALVVAAINILNLFTARVIRRRRLMSMSIALGADRRLLFRLTLSEALLLGIGGSLVGMLPAQGVITLLRTLLLGQAAAMTPGFADLISTIGIGWPDALAGLATGAGTSLLFGLYPAYLGASIDPAEGLRRE